MLLYIILFLHQTTTAVPESPTYDACISSFFYIKPQPIRYNHDIINLVYHPFSTSNHNRNFHRPFRRRLVYHPFSTSNHNSVIALMSMILLVYHPFSTSNHNLSAIRRSCTTLVYHPFSTSNHNDAPPEENDTHLYIILFLHQTTTYHGLVGPGRHLYIILFLHQTTTKIKQKSVSKSCISSFFYIKPQPSCGLQ